MLCCSTPLHPHISEKISTYIYLSAPVLVFPIQARPSAQVILIWNSFLIVLNQSKLNEEKYL